jgi:hypothetical protein
VSNLEELLTAVENDSLLWDALQIAGASLPLVKATPEEIRAAKQLDPMGWAEELVDVIRD